ncbi:MAG: VacB/RNase II family 3'-5' exoribonuclease, partial [Myxococcota bacterium]
GNCWIDPDDPRLRGPMGVVGKIPRDARPGDQVVAEVIRYPASPEDLPEVRVVDVLGLPGVTEVEVQKLKLRDGVIEGFEADVQAEAEAFPTRVTQSERRGREDLRDLELCTIDPVDARDHDDAVWADRRSDGSYRLVVAIADVSHYVQPGTAIDRAARERGCSIYLPDRAIPMLPAELSSNLASLQAKKDRLTLAVDMDIGPNGGVRSYRFVEGLMRSRADLTYEGVARALGLTDGVDRQREAEGRRDQLQVLLDLSRILRTRRNRRGTLDFDLPEGRVRFDDAGEPIDVYRTKADAGVRQTYQLVEEFMLLCNEVVAKDLSDRGVPAVYRVHGPPDEEKILRFVQLAHALGYDLDPEQALQTKSLSKFLRKMQGSPRSGALSYLLLRAMQQATYDTTNIGHFGLGAKHYLHYTSPIRRYPDLQVHRVVRAVARGEALDHPKLRHELKLSAVAASRLERRAMQLERDVMNLYRVIIMRDRVGEEFDAAVGGVAAHGLYATLDEPFVDTLCPVETLGAGFEMDNYGLALRNARTGANWTLGQGVRVRLEEASIERRELVATMLSEPKEGQPDEPRRGRGRGRRRAGEGKAPRAKGANKGGAPRGGPAKRRRRARKAEEGEGRDRRRKAPRRKSR